MLPSTGYFKGINCPFYDSGLCERPYCHFRHVKKESQNTSNEGIESGSILQKLVSAAVQKVLQQTEASGTATPSQSLPADVVAEVSKSNNVHTGSKATYNPTPISELNKINNIDSEDNYEQRRKHIPVPYTPRKPTSLAIKRPVENHDSSKPFIYNPPPVKYTPGATETVPIDLYTPKGTVELNEKYLPGSEIELQEYSPKESHQPSVKRNYVPSDKSVSKKKILEYKPTKVTSKSDLPSVRYQPTPRSLAPCFSSDEDEPNVKKRKLSSDLNGLDELGAEFDILDQILDEEKLTQDAKTKLEKCTDVKDCKENVNENNDIKKILTKIEDKKIKDKAKSNKKEKSRSQDRDKNDSKSNHSDKKERHKSANKDKSKEDKKEKHSTDKKKHSESKSSDRHSKSSSKKSSHRDSEKHAKHSRSVSKEKDKKYHHKSHKSSKESKEKHKKDKKEKHNRIPSDDDHNNSACESILNQNDDELYEMSESDEETIALECKRIFEEYVPSAKPKYLEEIESVEEDVHGNEYVPSKKRISRTTDKNIKIVRKAPVKPDFKVNAAQMMAERLNKVRDYHASKKTLEIVNNDNSSSISTDCMKNSLPTPNSGHTKIRIAHVPYASTLMNAKKTITPNAIATKSEPSTSSTVIQTVKKGIQRVAHVPNEKFIDRPGVLEPLASKIPANIRSTYLNMMIDECLKIYLSAADAYGRAQHEELTTSKKCTTIPIYKNSAVLTVSRLRKELQECKGVKKTGFDVTPQKSVQTISGKSSSAGTWSIESKNRIVNSQEFFGAKLYKNLCKWVLTEQQLQDNGFPRPHMNGEKGRAIIYGQNKQKPPVGYIRTCCRCKKDYTIDKKGFAAIKQECIYHPNNKYRIRGEVKYQCCGQDGSSDGCCIAPSHVYEYVDFENLKGYVTTLPPDRMLDDYGVYSLDCEMCYTTHGLDLTRVTVINSECKVVYETLIKPLHPIIDYNTRYSGITEEQMAQVKTTLLEVQATLLTMFNNKTILIGHSLESDFKALKLIHDTVIDTSVLFPHKMGPPYKRALRNLSSEYLKKIIQNSVDGHDSAEDAKACMELIHFKLKEDLKTR